MFSTFVIHWEVYTPHCMGPPDVQAEAFIHESADHAVAAWLHRMPYAALVPGCLKLLAVSRTVNDQRVFDYLDPGLAWEG